MGPLRPRSECCLLCGTGSLGHRDEDLGEIDLQLGPVDLQDLLAYIAVYLVLTDVACSLQKAVSNHRQQNLVVQTGAKFICWGSQTFQSEPHLLYSDAAIPSGSPFCLVELGVVYLEPDFPGVLQLRFALYQYFQRLLGQLGGVGHGPAIAYQQALSVLKLTAHIVVGYRLGVNNGHDKVNRSSSLGSGVLGLSANPGDSHHGCGQ